MFRKETRTSKIGVLRFAAAFSAVMMSVCSVFAEEDSYAGYVKLNTAIGLQLLHGMLLEGGLISKRPIAMQITTFQQARDFGGHPQIRKTTSLVLGRADNLS